MLVYVQSPFEIVAFLAVLETEGAGDHSLVCLCGPQKNTTRFWYDHVQALE